MEYGVGGTEGISAPDINHFCTTHLYVRKKTRAPRPPQSLYMRPVPQMGYGVWKGCRKTYKLHKGEAEGTNFPNSSFARSTAFVANCFPCALIASLTKVLN